MASSIALLMALGSSPPGLAVPLKGVWSSTYRNNIKVYLCITRFDQQFPSWDKDVLRANVRNALDTWNAYSGVDFHFSWQGDLTCSQPDCTGPGDPTECQDGELPSDNGKVAIRAQFCHQGRGVLASALWGPGPIIAKGAIGFYRANGWGCPNTITWTFDHTASGADFDSALMHVLAHVLGFFDHDPDGNGVASVVDTSLQNSSRLLWQEDLFKLRDTNQTYHYNLVTTRQTLHKRSTDYGLSWSPEGNLQEFTNLKIGVAFSPVSARYLVAWTAAEPWHRIHTILGNGAWYDSSTRVAHNGCNSHYGPAAVYGEGEYVIAWTLTNDTRRIAYRTSSDGTIWSSVRYVQYQGTDDYGSMWEPTLAYNANKGVFLVAWTNWETGWVDDALGHVRICASPDPASQDFGNCSEYYVVSNSPPALVCHSTANECILAWTNSVGYYDHHISYRKGFINASGYFELTGLGYYYTNVSSRLAPHLGYGNGYWMLSFRKNDGTGANLRMAVGNWPYWSDWTYPDSPLQASPAIQFGSTWNVFAYYYSKR